MTPLHTNTVFAWAHADSDEISRRFHNMLLHDPVWYALLTKLWWLCAYDAPWGRGRYRHHDGLQA